MRLGGRLEVLKAEPGAGLPERHRTLRAAIEWSYDLLGAEEQALFTSLGVFVGGFTLDGAKAVAGDLELDVVDGVESLLNNSLLRTEPMAGGEPRFGMLETIREYALERLAERGDGDAVRRRHAGFYLPLAEEAEPALLGPQQLSWLERLDAERDNLRAALTWATETARRTSVCGSALRSGATGSCEDPTRRAASAWSGCSRGAVARKAARAMAQARDRSACGRRRATTKRCVARRGEPARPPRAGRRRTVARHARRHGACPPWRWVTATGRVRSPRRRSRSRGVRAT